MSIATIYNPLSENKSKLLVYYNAPNGRLNHFQWTAPDTRDDIYTVNDAEPLEKIPRLAALTTFIYKDTIRVYTVVNIKNAAVATDPGKNILALVSPVYRSLEIETKYTQIAGCSDGKNGWVYYLGNKGNNVTLVEKTLGTTENNHIAKSFMIWSDDAGITKLGACYTPSDKKRYVCFQAGDEKLIVYDVKASKDVGIDDSGDSLPGTWLTMCTHPRGNKDVICVYYINRTGQIRRASWVKGDEVWAKATVSQEVLPDSASQLSVAVSPELKQNIVAYMMKGSTDVQYLPDPWVEA